MSAWCTCLPDGPHDPDCPVAPAHEAMDRFAADLHQMAVDFAAVTENAIDHLNRQDA